MSMRRRQISAQPLLIPSAVAERESDSYSMIDLSTEVDVTSPTRSKHPPSKKAPDTFFDPRKGTDREAHNLPADEADRPDESSQSLVSRTTRRDKAAQLLGIPHHASMEPIPVNRRMSLVSIRSAPVQPPSTPAYIPTAPLASLYVVSGLPKSPQTWTLADIDAVHGLSHADGAVNRWWRAEVLGNTVTPGVGGGKKRKSARGHTEVVKGVGALTKQETAKMLSKALKVFLIHFIMSTIFISPFI